MVVVVVELRVVLSDERGVCFKLYFNYEFKCIMFQY
jgi:hypothetical protein